MYALYCSFAFNKNKRNWKINLFWKSIWIEGDRNFWRI
ncbi:mitochondrial large ribosomal subunit protein bL28m [Leptotrichia sp. oral taxon 218]|nr:mitochondrial large ribosomal subunit protein bL28m [Leptotrichia sp. oral taxon 218]